MPGFVAELPTPTRLFTVEQANALLPDILPVVASLREHALALRAEQAVLDELARRAEEMGGVQPTAREAEAAVHACEHLNSLGVNIPDVNAEVATLSGGQRQAIAVARSVFSDAKIILLDEPLAAMGAKEGGLIIKLIRELRERGDVSQIVIAHNYLHVLETCDRVCLLQNGRITFDSPSAETSVEELLTLVGAEYRVPDA